MLIKKVGGRGRSLWCIGKERQRGLVSNFFYCCVWLLIDHWLALHEPYVIAVEPSFVEVRHIETGLMSQVIQGNNLRLLFADTPPSVSHNTGYNHPHPYQQTWVAFFIFFLFSPLPFLRLTYSCFQGSLSPLRCTATVRWSISTAAARSRTRRSVDSVWR